MLDGLDAVQWATLNHAYGPATDVPDVLRRLATGDGEALNELFGNIWHQGTVYPATAPAVPFLFELLASKEVDVVGVLTLLTSIAGGASYLDVHQSLMPASRRPAPEAVEAELVWVRAARDAVKQGAPHFVALLSHGDEEVRAAAVDALVSCGAARTMAPVLRAAASRESSPVVRASFVIALGADDDAWLSDPDPAVRVVASVVRGARTTQERDLLLVDVPAALETLSNVPGVRDRGEPMRFVLDSLDEQPGVELELLQAWMRNVDPTVRESAVFASERLLHSSRAASALLCPALAARLEDEAPGVRRWAATLLAQSGSAAAGAADALWKALERETPQRATVAGNALLALCQVKDPRAGLWMSRRLRELSATRAPLGFIGEAVELLGPWSPHCLEPLVQLIPLSQAGNERIAVIKAVAAYGSSATSAIPQIVAQLETQPHITTRVLGDFGSAAAMAVEPLRRMVGHSIERVSMNAARAVFLIAKDPAPALGLINAAFEQPSSVSASILELVADLGPAAVKVAPKLPPLFESDNDWVSVWAAAAFWAVTGDATRVLPTMLGRHLVPLPRGLVAVKCLAAMGPRASEASPRLREFVESPNRQVRSGVTSTLIADDERWMQVCSDALARVSTENA